MATVSSCHDIWGQGIPGGLSSSLPILKLKSWDINSLFVWFEAKGETCGRNREAPSNLGPGQMAKPAAPLFFHSELSTTEKHKMNLLLHMSRCWRGDLFSCSFLQYLPSSAGSWVNEIKCWTKAATPTDANFSWPVLMATFIFCREGSTWCSNTRKPCVCLIAL